MLFSIKNEEISALNEIHPPCFPKYTSQLINWANQNAHGTRPKVVGQLSELFPAYQKQTETTSVDSWRTWYLDQYPEAIDIATNKIYDQVKYLQQAIMLIDKDMVRQWVEDLVITKTYNGLYLQKAILAKLASIKCTSYRLADATEEARGIDGYVGDTAYSIKPDTYKTMDRLSENIEVKMIYYTKKKDRLIVQVDE